VTSAVFKGNYAVQHSPGQKLSQLRD